MLHPVVLSSFPHQSPGQPVVFVMRQKFDALFRQGFIRLIGILVGGTAFAQALMVLVLPLLTRLYTPEDFNVLAVYASILSIISVAACLRLEITVPLPLRLKSGGHPHHGALPHFAELVARRNLCYIVVRT